MLYGCVGMHVQESLSVCKIHMGTQSTYWVCQLASNLPFGAVFEHCNRGYEELQRFHTDHRATGPLNVGSAQKIMFKLGPQDTGGMVGLFREEEVQLDSETLGF